MALKENSRKIYDYVKANDGEKVTVPLMERVEAEVEAEDGTHAKVKFIRLTDAGRKFNPDAE